MSVDADRLVNLCLSFHELWSLPAQIGIALWLLYTQVCSAPYSSWCVVFSKAGLNRDATKHKGTRPEGLAYNAPARTIACRPQFSCCACCARVLCPRAAHAA